MVVSSTPIRLLLVIEYRLMREGLRALIEKYPDIEIVGETNCISESVRLTVNLQPDVILIGLFFVDQSNIKILKTIAEKMPEAHVLVLSTQRDDEIVFSAIRVGALGFLLEVAGIEDLISSIHRVHLGQPALDASIALKLIDEIKQKNSQPMDEKNLTDREMEVLDLLAKGFSNQEIGKTLTIAERTVSAHVNRILRKLNVTNRTQAALLAYQAGNQKDTHSNHNT